MADPTAILGYPRASFPYVSPGGTYSAGADQFGNLAHSNFLPKYSMISATSMVYSISPGVVANAAIPITDIPTTTATWAFYNKEAVLGNGYSKHILKIGVHLASGTSGVGGSLWVGLSPTAQAAAVANATGIVGPKPCNASASARTDLTTLGTAITLAGAPAWSCLGGFLNHAAVATVGSGQIFDVDGLIVVPPTFALGIEVLSGTGTTAKYAITVWYASIPMQNT